MRETPQRVGAEWVWVGAQFLGDQRWAGNHWPRHGVPQRASPPQHPPGEMLTKVQEGEIAPGTVFLRRMRIFLLIRALEGCLADSRRYGRYGTGRGVGWTGLGGMRQGRRWEWGEWRERRSVKDTSR